jgi:tetratricopeptide (TPR) repeat protein
VCVEWLRAFDFVCVYVYSERERERERGEEGEEGENASDHSCAVENTRIFTTEEKREILESPSARPEYATAKVKRELGNELLGDGNLEGAIQMYSSAIELSPEMKEAYSNRASALIRLAKQRQLQGGDGAQELEKGLKDAQKARELDPEWAKGHYREGQVYRAMGNLPEAGLCFWEALKLDPHSREARDMFRKCVDEGRRKAGAQGNGLMSEEEMKEKEKEEEEEEEKEKEKDEG